MNLQKINEEDCKSIYVGEAITLSAVLAILATAVVAVLVYKLFLSSKGSAALGDWKFSWAWFMKIADIPKCDRPREKALLYGVETLSDAELLAIFINYGQKGHSALDIANDLLTASNGLYNLSNLNQKDLVRIKGIDKVRCLQLSVLFALMNRIKNKKIDMEDKPVDIDYINKKYNDYLNNMDSEVVLLLVLNRNKKIIHETIVYKGNFSSVSTEINEVIKTVILHDGYYFYLVHNHPNGSREPSPQDLLLTFRLNSSVKKMKIRLLDHIIVHRGGYTSVNSYLSQEYNYRNVLQIPAN